MDYQELKFEKKNKLEFFKDSYIKTLDVNKVKIQANYALAEASNEIQNWKRIVSELYPAHYLIDNIRDSRVISTDIVNLVEQSANEIISTFFYPMIERVSIEVANDYFSMKEKENDSKFLEKLSSAISKSIADENNNFGRIQKQSLLDYIILGNAAVQQKYDEERKCFRYYQIPLDSVYIRTDFNKNLQHIFRDFILTWFEVLEYFNEKDQEQIIKSAPISEMEKEIHNRRFAFIEFYEFDKVSNCWYCTVIYKFGQTELARISTVQYDYQPILYLRANLQMNSHYAKSILWNHLASIVVFNSDARLLQVSKQRALLPPLITIDGAFESDLDFSADANNRVKEAFIGKAVSQPLTPMSNLNAIFPIFQTNSQNIGQILGQNSLLNANKDDKGEYPPVTTVELRQRVARISLVAPLQALEDQLMKPIIEAHLAKFMDEIIEEAKDESEDNKKPKKEKDDKEDEEFDEEEDGYKLTHDGIRIPNELIDYYKKQGKKIKIQYKSGITDILEQADIQKEENAIQILRLLAQIAPSEIPYYINLAGSMKVFIKRSQYPELFNSPEKAEQLKADAMKKQEQMQQQQMQLEEAKVQQQQQK